ncbi:hypothetical protein D3C81_2031560 [compost metagenome]
MNSVKWLEDESQTVRLARGSMDEGRMKGNIDAPTLRMMPLILRPLHSSANISRRKRRPSKAPTAPIKPAMGAAIVHGCAW